jgi:hypothetical protein
MEEETVEEAAANYGWRIKKNTFSDAVKANELAESAQQDFIAGAEWQSERMYSEEDMKKAYERGMFAIIETGHGDTFEEWFTKFKNKEI